MGSKSTSSLALLLILNLLFFTSTSACFWGRRCRDTPQRPRYPTTPSLDGKCPPHAPKLGVCLDVLHGLVNTSLGLPPVQPCCSVIKGLLDLEVAVCLCTSIDLNLLGIPINIPLSLSLILNNCGVNVPDGFKCA